MTISQTEALLSRPSWRFVFSRPAHFIAFSGGVGLISIAPGSWGTLIALPIYWGLAPFLEGYLFLLLVLGLFLLGIWACDAAGKALGVADYGGFVWDETVAFLLVLFFLPSNLLWQAVGFLIFRFFDIFKPQPIRYFDRTFKNGFGVMLDDLIAASFTLLCFAGAKAAGLEFS